MQLRCSPSPLKLKGRMKRVLTVPVVRKVVELQSVASFIFLCPCSTEEENSQSNKSDVGACGVEEPSSSVVYESPPFSPVASSSPVGPNLGTMPLSCTRMSASTIIMIQNKTIDVSFHAFQSSCSSYSSSSIAVLMEGSSTKHSFLQFFSAASWLVLVVVSVVVDWLVVLLPLGSCNSSSANTDKSSSVDELSEPSLTGSFAMLYV